MATIGTSYRDGPAMRMHLEQLEKRMRAAERAYRAQLRDTRERRSVENSRQIVEAARATGAVVVDVWVDQPTAEGA